MTALWALIRKDLILYRSDRRAWMMNLLMPVVLGAFFGYLFGGSGAADPIKVNVALTVQDDSPISRKIADGLKADKTLQVTEMPQEQAQEQVKKGKLNAAIVIPAGFGEAASGAMFGPQAKPEIKIFYDPSQNMVLAMVKGMLTQEVMQTVSGEVFSGAGGSKMIDKSIAKLEQLPSNPGNTDLRDFLQSVKQFQGKINADPGAKENNPLKAGLSLPFTTSEEALTSGPSRYNGYAHSFGGMSVQFILFMAIDAGIGILLSQRLGVWNRFLAAPVTMSTIITARALSCAIIAFCLQCFIFGVAVLAFGVHIDGSVPGFFGILVSFALMTSAFGLLIAAFGKTPEAARGLSVFATLMMVMLGGAWVPAFLFPHWMQSLTLVVPTRWAVDGLDAMTWRGLPFEAALPPMGVLLGFTVLFGALALWRFKRD